jgi:hypothetical protein
MSHPGAPSPDLNPYFVPEGHGPKGGAKWAPPGEEVIRRDLLPTEAAFRVAGTIGMVLAGLGHVHPVLDAHSDVPGRPRGLRRHPLNLNRMGGGT